MPTWATVAPECSPQPPTGGRGGVRRVPYGAPGAARSSSFWPWRSSSSSRFPPSARERVVDPRERAHERSEPDPDARAARDRGAGRSTHPAPGERALRHGDRLPRRRRGRPAARPGRQAGERGLLLEGLPPDLRWRRWPRHVLPARRRGGALDRLAERRRSSREPTSTRPSTAPSSGSRSYVLDEQGPRLGDRRPADRATVGRRLDHPHPGRSGPDGGLPAHRGHVEDRHGPRLLGTSSSSRSRGTRRTRETRSRSRSTRPRRCRCAERTRA